MTVYKLKLMVGFACAALATCAPKDGVQPKPNIAYDTCIFGGTIYRSADVLSTGLMDKTSVLLIKDGVIVNTDAEKCPPSSIEPVQKIDLDGATAFPGFTDAHAHLLGIGLRETILNLEGVESITDLKSRIESAVETATKGETVYGRGWIETHWPEGRFPTAADLDDVSPDNPVILERADGHAIVVNGMALAKSGITKDTQSPSGGEILHDKNGNPSGMLIDNAGRLVASLIGELSPTQRQAAYKKAGEVYAAYGWTGMHNMSAATTDLGLLETLSTSGNLGIRVYNAVDMNGAESILSKIRQSGPVTNENGHISTRAIKLYSDGALGSRGAALLSPYSDRPNASGLMMVDEAAIMPILEDALRNGIQMSTHAIGDKANRLVLDWYETAFNNVPNSERKVTEPRWRIEHSQILHIDDIKRFADLGVIASMQPSHAIGDLHFAVDRLGVDRLRGGYAWRRLIDSGAIIAAGSDAPVERGDPRIEFYAAIARKDKAGFSGEGWYPDQKVSRSEALKMLTEWPAYAAFTENTLGKLQTGYKADITVFDRDLMTIPEADILSAKALYTIVGGKIIYQAE